MCLYIKCNLAFQNSLKSPFVDAWVRAHAKWTELPEEAKKIYDEEYQQKLKNYKDVAAACKANKQGEGQKKHSQKKQAGAPKDQQVAHTVASWLLSGLNFKQNASAKDFK